MTDDVPSVILRALHLADDTLDRLDSDDDRVRTTLAAVRAALPLVEGMATDQPDLPWTGWPATDDLQLSRCGAELTHALGQPSCPSDGCARLRLTVARVVGALWRLRRPGAGR